MQSLNFPQKEEYTTCIVIRLFFERRGKFPALLGDEDLGCPSVPYFRHEQAPG